MKSVSEASFTRKQHRGEGRFRESIDPCFAHSPKVPQRTERPGTRFAGQTGRLPAKRESGSPHGRPAAERYPALRRRWSASCSGRAA